MPTIRDREGADVSAVGPVLYVVATPIGNLEDITLRALRVLREADVLFAEDTRHTGQLLSAHGIGRQGRSISCHEHNENERVALLLSLLAEGETVALCTDAGTPGISDPGYRLVCAAREAGYPVVPVPGACAAVAALSASGLPTDRFTFAGFPPKKPGPRGRWLEGLAEGQGGTLVLYAAARDVAEILDDLASTRADPAVVVYRELTKHFEECRRGKASELAAGWRADPGKGEVVIVADRAPEAELDDEALIKLLADASPADVSAATGISKRRLYQLALTLKPGR